VAAGVDAAGVDAAGAGSGAGAGAGAGMGAGVDLGASSSIGESGRGGGMSVPSVKLKSKDVRAGSSNRPLGLPLIGMFAMYFLNV